MAFAHTAPLCRGVFYGTANTLSPEAISRTIKQIAQLKFNNDLAQANGNDRNTVKQSIKVLFPAKYKELVDALDGRIPEAQILELIKEEIGRLQEDKNKSENNRHRVNKEIESRKYSYDLVDEGIDGFSSQMMTSDYTYLPDSKSILYFDNTSFNSYNLAYKNTRKIADASLGVLKKDNNTYLLNIKDELTTYDLDSQTFGPALKIQTQSGEAPPFPFSSILLSPSETYVILAGYTDKLPVRPTSIVDLQTGKEILNHDDLPQTAVNISFLNDQQIAILTKENDLKIMDLGTKQIVRTISLKMFTDHALLKINFTPMLSNDGSILSILREDGFVSFRASDLSPISQNLIPKKLLRLYANAKGFNQAFIETDYTNSLKIFDMNSLWAEFDFDGHYTGQSKEAYKVAVSPDGQQIAVLYERKGVRAKLIDIWIRSPSK
jgi:WD40 repeat protein